MIDQVLFVADVAGQQIGYEYIGKRMFAVERVHHGLFFDAQEFAIGHGGSGAHAQTLTGERSFSKEVAFAHNSDGRFFARLRYHSELNFSFLQIENGIGRIALREDYLSLGRNHQLAPIANGREESRRIEFLDNARG